MKFTLTLSLALLLFCCTQRTFHTPLTVSTKVGAVQNYMPLTEVSSTSCHKMVLGFGFSANYKKMYQRLIEDSEGLGGDAIINFQVRSKSFFFLAYPITLYFSCYEAVGLAIKINRSHFDGASAWDKPTDSLNQPSTPSKWDLPSK